MATHIIKRYGTEFPVRVYDGDDWVSLNLGLYPSALDVTLTLNPSDARRLAEMLIEAADKVPVKEAA